MPFSLTAHNNLSINGLHLRRLGARFYMMLDFLYTFETVIWLFLAGISASS